MDLGQLLDRAAVPPGLVRRTVAAMTTRRATVLSVLGVIVAGLVAALVNTQALAGGDRRGDGLLASPQPAPTATSTPAAATSSSAPDTTVTAPATIRRAFAAGPAGTLTLDGSSGVLELVSVVPADGWLVSSVTSDGAGQVVVEFTTMGQDLVATGVLTGGVITMNVVSETPGTGSTTPVDPSTAPPSSGTEGPGTTAGAPSATDPRPTATAGATTTTVHDDDDSDDHGSNSGSGSGKDDSSDDDSSGGSGHDHDEPDD
jgi:hypothetical protein